MKKKKEPTPKREDQGKGKRHSPGSDKPDKNDAPTDPYTEDPEKQIEITDDPEGTQQKIPKMDY